MKYEVLKDITENRPQFIPGTPEELDAVSAAPDNHIILFEKLPRRIRKLIQFFIGIAKLNLNIF